jgi:ABC-type long-subunit fatty acid transport system fused permease/ATPase subunit
MFADDTADRISLGTLTKVANSFGHVFSSMAVLGENWGEVNNFRSTVRRLREFEAQQTCARRRSGHLELDEDL